MRKKSRALKNIPTLSKQLKQIRDQSVPKAIPVKLTRKLAFELLALRPENARPLHSEMVWLWAFIYYSGPPIEYYDSPSIYTITIDDFTNTLIDSGHRIAGFLTSGIKTTDVYIVFKVDQTHVAL